MAVSIPMTAEPIQEGVIVLGGQAVLIKVQWNEIAQGWFLDLRWPDSRGAIALSRRLNHATRVLGGVRRITAFQGDIVAVGPIDKPTLWSGGSGELVYLDEDEIAIFEKAAIDSVIREVEQIADPGIVNQPPVADAGADQSNYRSRRGSYARW